MANLTTKNGRDMRLTLLLVACGTLLLALISVSAFAYQWHSENVALKKSNQTLRALTDQSTLTSLNDELFTVQQELYATKSENEEYERRLKEYETILNENNLLPAATATATN